MSAAVKSVPGALATGSATDTQLPNSRRIYIDGSQLGVRVPFREIGQNPTRNFKNELEENPPVRVYDTSGPYGDPSVHCDAQEGLTALRREWIVRRGDVEEYEGRVLQPIDDGYLTFDAANHARQKEKGRLEDFPALRRTPLRAKTGACVTQMHYAKQGIITPEMEYIAIRENLGRRKDLECGGLTPLSDDRSSLNHQHKGVSFGASIPSYVTPEFVRDEVARGR
ncbi:MAG TPA: phosphomethylpyrimidine synthase, partial [Blastocatellia bacterium]|nr:phosphomethylpyrimidine synthase [Blastocatellia bacterium]